MLSTDFSGANSLADWQVRDGTDVLGGPSIWEISNGQLRQVSDFDGAPAMYPTALVTGNSAWRDYEARVAAYSSGNEAMGVVVRASDRGYYVFRVYNEGVSLPKYAIERFDAASYTFHELASADGAGFATERWYELSVVVLGDRMQAFVDGQPVLDVRDGTLGQGSAGVYGIAEGRLLFDSFSVLPVGGR
ncbi:MAG TPA: hypothetical protein PKC19_22530 [Roseiflexaceae bacterium]|nr:hypothetical protein [Roseiflexaceae bacterium]